MLKHKTYPCTVQGLENAIADRHTTLKIRRVLVVIGVIGLISVISPSTAATVAFKCL